MSFKDWSQSMLDKLKQNSGYGGGQMESNMAHGGFSGYRPEKVRPEPQQQMMEQPLQPPMGMGFDMNQQPMAYEAPQQPMEFQPQADPYGPTGFTGMVPAMGGYPQQQMNAPYPQQGTEAYLGQTNGFQQYPQGMEAQLQPMQGMDFQQPGYQQPMQPTGYQQPMQSQNTGYQPQAWNQPQANAWQPQQPAWPEQPRVDHLTQRNFRIGGYQYQEPPARSSFTSRFQHVPQEPAPQPVQDNISYMPGSFVGDDGKAYSHVERVVQLLSVSACFRLIEFMRNGESVIVNTEQIASEGEIQRCLDMLSGAAFTLGCTITKITTRRSYLIAPATVLVMPDTVIQRMSERDGNQWSAQEEESRRDNRSYYEERGPRTASRRDRDDFGYGSQPSQRYGTFGR